MKVILKEKVKSLGEIGEIVAVSPGYARNYLIPKGMGIAVHERNKRQLGHYKKMLASKMAQEKENATSIAQKLEKTEIEFFKKVAASGKIFGAVTTMDLSKALAKRGIEIERRLITLEKPIKTLGHFKAKARIYRGVEAHFSIKVIVEPSESPESKKSIKESS